MTKHGEASVICDDTKSWEVTKEYCRFHTAARDGSECAVVQPLDWIWDCMLHKKNITQKGFNTYVQHKHQGFLGDNNNVTQTALFEHPYRNLRQHFN